MTVVTVTVIVTLTVTVTLFPRISTSDSDFLWLKITVLISTLIYEWPVFAQTMAVVTGTVLL